MNEWHGFGIACNANIGISRSGNKYASFGFGLKQKKSDPNLTFFRVVCFDEVAEFIEKYIDKPKRLFVHGRLEKNEIEDSFYIVAHRVHFLPTIHESNIEVQ